MNKKIVLIAMVLLVLGLFTAPTYATKAHYAVHSTYSNGYTYPYIDVGYWHYGSYIIWGYAWWGNKASPRYEHSGTILPIFSRYWGHGLYSKGARSVGFDSIASF